jgi:hypothetical protein
MESGGLILQTHSPFVQWESSATHFKGHESKVKELYDQVTVFGHYVWILLHWLAYCLSSLFYSFIFYSFNTTIQRARFLVAKARFHVVLPTALLGAVSCQGGSC